MKHREGDTCLAQHYTATNPDGEGEALLCGADFMAGTICSRHAGHDGGHEAECVWCGGDWINGTCTCPTEAEDDE